MKKLGFRILRLCISGHASLRFELKGGSCHDCGCAEDFAQEKVST